MAKNSCAQGWEVIKEMESNKANFTGAEKKLLQYLFPVLEPNSNTKTSSSTLRKNPQVSSLQITDSCWKLTWLTALILFLNHFPWHLPSHGFSQNKAESWCFVHETGFTTIDSLLVLAHASREQAKTCKVIFFWEVKEEFSKENEPYMRKWHSKEDRKGLEQIYISFPKTCSSLDPLVYLEMLGRGAAQ